MIDPQGPGAWAFQWSREPIAGSAWRWSSNSGCGALQSSRAAGRLRQPYRRLGLRVESSIDVADPQSWSNLASRLAQDDIELLAHAATVKRAWTRCNQSALSAS